MPGYIIHLTEADIVWQQMPDWYRSLCPEASFDSEWKREYLCGSVLPDSVPRPQKKRTHFWVDTDMDKILVTPCLQQFMLRHSKDLLDPLVLGYLAHLHLDYTFFTDYFLRFIRFVDASGSSTLVSHSIHHVELTLQHRDIFVDQLFSDDYLYGDYTKLNAQLIQKYGLPDLLCPQRVDNPFDMCLPESMATVKEELEQYLEESRNTAGETQILRLSSLEAFIRQAANDFWQHLENYIRRDL